jgi:hypothetical protein
MSVLVSASISEWGYSRLIEGPARIFRRVPDRYGSPDFRFRGAGTWGRVAPHWQRRPIPGASRCGLTLRCKSVLPRLRDPDRHDLGQPTGPPNRILPHAREPAADQLRNHARVEAVQCKQPLRYPNVPCAREHVEGAAFVSTKRHCVAQSHLRASNKQRSKAGAVHSGAGVFSPKAR